MIVGQAKTTMASAQVLNGEEQAIFDELISATLGKADDVIVEPIMKLVTVGFIKNYHKDKLALQIIDQHDWSGEPARPYPQVIPAEIDPVEFVHLGPIPQGSKAGVVYADGTDSTARKWLVAFDGQAKKVRSIYSIYLYKYIKRRDLIPKPQVYILKS